MPNIYLHYAGIVLLGMMIVFTVYIVKTGKIGDIGMPYFVGMLAFIAAMAASLYYEIL